MKYIQSAIDKRGLACSLFAAMLLLTCAAGCNTQKSNDGTTASQQLNAESQGGTRQIGGETETIATAPPVIAPRAIGSGDTEKLAIALAALKGRVEARVDLSFTDVTDDDLGALDFPDTVHEIDLSTTQVTDRGVENLLRVRNLQTLVLTDTKVSEGVVEILKRMPSLCEVRLDNTSVSSELQFELIRYFAPRATARAEFIQSR